MVAPMIAAAVASAVDIISKIKAVRPKKFNSLFEPIVYIANKIIERVRDFVVKLPGFIIGLSALLTSSFILAILLGILSFIVIILLFVHPRPMLLNRYANMDYFKDRVMEDVKRCMNVLIVRQIPSSLPPQYHESATYLRNLGVAFSYDGNFDVHLDIYMKYQDTFERMKKNDMVYNKVGEATFTGAGLFLDGNNQYDHGQAIQFYNNFIVPWKRFCKQIRQFKNGISTDHVLLLTSGGSTELHEFIGVVMEMDLVLNDYLPVGLENLALRKGGLGKFNFVIFERYYAPFVKDMWANGVKNSAKLAGKMFLDIFVGCDKMWSRLGEMIGRIPCMLAPDYADKCRQTRLNIKIGKIQSEYDDMNTWDAFTPDQIREKLEMRDERDASKLQLRRGWSRRKLFDLAMLIVSFGRYRHIINRDNPIEMFGEDGEEIDNVLRKYDVPKEDDANPADVTEHFGTVFALARTVHDFFRNFYPLGLQLIKYGKDFSKDPFMSLFGIFAILVGPLVGLIVLFYYVLWCIPWYFGVSCAWILFWWISAGCTVIYFVGSFLIRIFLMIFLFFIFLGLWMVDMLTGGLLVKLMQCEDDPDAPEVRKNYIHGNGYKRGVFGCLYPCFNGFQPRPLFFLGNTPYLCVRQDRSSPNMCPQQQILRFFRGRTLLKPYAYDMYKPGLTFRFRSLQDKVQIIRQTFKKRKEFLKSCDRSLSEKFGHISRHVCSNVHNYEYVSVEEKDAVKLLCKQMYCEGRSKDDRVCNYLNSELINAPEVQMGEEPLNIISKAIIVAIVGFLFLVVALALMRAARSRTISIATDRSKPA